MEWDQVRGWLRRTFKPERKFANQPRHILFERCEFSAKDGAVGADNLAHYVAEATRMVTAVCNSHLRPVTGDRRVTPEGLPANSWCEDGCACIRTGHAVRWFFGTGATVEGRPPRPVEPQVPHYQVHFPDGCWVYLWQGEKNAVRTPIA